MVAQLLVAHHVVPQPAATWSPNLRTDTVAATPSQRTAAREQPINRGLRRLYTIVPLLLLVLTAHQGRELSTALTVITYEGSLLQSRCCAVCEGGLAQALGMVFRVGADVEEGHVGIVCVLLRDAATAKPDLFRIEIF